MPNNKAFRTACREGQVEIVKQDLLDPTLDVNFCDKRATPLISATVGNHRNIVSLLLANKRIKISEKNSENKTAFSYAVALNHFDIATLLLTDVRFDFDTEMPTEFIRTINSHLSNKPVHPTFLFLLAAIDIVPFFQKHYANRFKQLPIREMIRLFPYFIAACLADKPNPDYSPDNLRRIGLMLMGDQADEIFDMFFNEFFDHANLEYPFKESPAEYLPRFVQEIQTTRAQFQPQMLRNTIQNTAAEIYSLLWLLNGKHAYLSAKTSFPQDSKIVRFFNIGKQLNWRSQLVLANRTCDLAGDVIAAQEKIEATVAILGMKKR
jgi:hypothetical protein